MKPHKVREIQKPLCAPALYAAVVSVMLFILVPQSAHAEKYTHVGDNITYHTKYEDTLVHIARSHDLGYVEVRIANPEIDAWLPGSGKKMILPARHILPDADQKGIVINLPEMRLYYFNETDKASPAIITHPIGVGRTGLETPLGKTTVRDKKIGPSWRPTDRMREEDPSLPEVVKPGPLNPLGTHALYLNWPSYAIHGTNKPFGIGRRVSSGCIRLYPEDILRFYDRVPVGTAVQVVNQSIKTAWIDDALFLEAHPHLEDATFAEENGYVKDYKLTQEELSLVLKAAGKDSALLDWNAIRNVVRSRNGVATIIAKRPTDVAGQTTNN